MDIPHVFLLVPGYVDYNSNMAREHDEVMPDCEIQNNVASMEALRGERFLWDLRFDTPFDVTSMHAEIVKKCYQQTADYSHHHSEPIWPDIKCVIGEIHFFLFSCTIKTKKPVK
jgi:hypothetical protein